MGRQGNRGRSGVYLLDDHELGRRGLRLMLEDEGIDVVGESGSAAEAVRRIPATRPRGAVLDLRLPDGSGIDVCNAVRAEDPGIVCLVLSGDEDPRARRGAFEAGAAGFLLKGLPSTGLVQAVRRAAAGTVLFGSPPGLEIAGSPLGAPADPGPAELTGQEWRVLRLLSARMSNREISAELFLAEKTVKNYFSSILAKLGLQGRTQAALYMVRRAPDPWPGGTRACST